MMRFMIGTIMLATATVAWAADSKTVELKDAQGQSVGLVEIAPAAHGGVQFKLHLQNLPPGKHAFHVHQSAKCEPPDFKSAGPHFNPANKQHGLKNPQGHHAGDMRNLTVKKNGKFEGTIANAEVTLGEGANSLFANGGTALVIHAKPDDMKSDPAGNAGDRIACGAVTQ